MSERSNYAHNGEVVGVACDSTNTLMISAGYHGDIKVCIFFSRFVCTAFFTTHVIYLCGCVYVHKGFIWE